MSSTFLPITFELRALVSRGKFSLQLREFNECVIRDPVFCFESANLDAIDDNAVLKYAKHPKLPFLTCLFELNLPQDNFLTHFVGVLVDTSREKDRLEKFNGALIVMELIARDAKRRWATSGIWWTDGNNWTMDPCYFDDDESMKEVGNVADGLVSRGCYAIEHGDTAHNDVSGVKRRILSAKGVHGFQYKVVRIDHASRTRDAPIGTHASPRWHLRRSHTRTIKATGKVVMVRSCEVGSKETGAVVKDYLVN